MKINADAVIIGAGLTGLTTGFYLSAGGKNIFILEKSDRTGGVIRSVAGDGFLYETGPNTGVLSTPELVGLFDDLDTACTPETANEGAGKRYILWNGNWTPLPSGLVSAITTPLFSLADKFRILTEPFRKRGTDPDETVEKLVLRRLGKSYLDYAVNPFISGIYAGDPSKLVTRFALPKLYALEQNYGSFIRGAVAKAREKKTELEKRVTRKVFSVKGGLDSLTGALTAAIGTERIITGCSKTVVSKLPSGFMVNAQSREEKIEISAPVVITTVGGYALPDLLPFIRHDLLNNIATLRYARVVQAIAGYNKWAGMKLDAFGGLVPAVEKREILGILFPSAIFDGRAPEGGALLSVFMGGERNPGLIRKTDEEIRSIALREISETLHCISEPDLFHIFRYEHAIPQYDKSSGPRLESIARIQKDFPGLILGGNIRDGIGMADRVKQGKMIASALLSE